MLTLEDEEIIKGNFQHLIAQLVLIRDMKYLEKLY